MESVHAALAVSFIPKQSGEKSNKKEQTTNTGITSTGKNYLGNFTEFRKLCTRKIVAKAKTQIF